MMDSLTVLMFVQLSIPGWSPLNGGGKMAWAKSPSTPEEMHQTKPNQTKPNQTKPTEGPSPSAIVE